MARQNMAVDMKALTGTQVITDTERTGVRIFTDPRISSIGIFFGAILALFFYLLALRYEVNLPVPVFFIAIALIVFSILYQILFLDMARGFSGMVIFEITLAAVVFHLIYQLPTYGLYGTDGYLDMASMQAILESGHIAGIPGYVQITSFFPVIHIMGAELSLVTGIDYFDIAKFFPTIMASIAIPMIYLSVRFLFKKEKAALLAALLFACIQHYVMFGSLFVRETAGIVLVISSIYFFTAARESSHPLLYRFLAIVSLGGTILAHHLTSLMFIMLLVIYWIFSALASIPTARQRLLGEQPTHHMTLPFLLIAIVGTLAYWLTTVTEPVQIGIMFLDNILTPSTWGLRTIFDQETVGLTSLPNLRYYFLVYGSYVCYLLFGLMLVYKTFSRRGKPVLETPVFMIYLVICGVLGFFSYFVLSPTVGGDRFLAYGWLFAFGPLALTIIEYRSKFMASISVILVVFFIFINLFTIHPTIWDPNSSGVGGAAQREDFALADTIDFSKGEVIGYQNDIMTIYNVDKKLGTDVGFLLDPIQLSNFRWVVINRAGLEEEGLYSTHTKQVIDEMKQLDAGASEDYHRVYESNNLAVLEKR